MFAFLIFLWKSVLNQVPQGMKLDNLTLNHLDCQFDAPQLRQSYMRFVTLKMNLSHTLILKSGSSKDAFKLSDKHPN